MQPLNINYEDYRETGKYYDVMLSGRQQAEPHSAAVSGVEDISGLVKRKWGLKWSGGGVTRADWSTESLKGLQKLSLHAQGLGAEGPCVIGGRGSRSIVEVTFWF